MVQRKPFFVKGNSQLKFLFCFVVICAAGISLATVLIYRSVWDLVEQASFSSHLSVRTSAELFRGVIVDVNMKVAVATMGAGLLFILWMHLYLQTFFSCVRDGLAKLGDGDFSFRLKVRGSRQGAGLSAQFNGIAWDMAQRAGEIKEVALKAGHMIDQGGPAMGKELREINRRLKTIRCP